MELSWLGSEDSVLGYAGKWLVLDAFLPDWAPDEAALIEALAGRLTGANRDLRLRAIETVMLHREGWGPTTRDVLWRQLPLLYQSLLDDPESDPWLLLAVVRALGALRHPCIAERLDDAIRLASERDQQYGGISNAVSGSLLCAVLEAGLQSPPLRERLRRDSSRAVLDGEATARARQLALMVFMESLSVVCSRLPAIPVGGEARAGARTPGHDRAVVTEAPEDLAALSTSGDPHDGERSLQRIAAFYGDVASALRADPSKFSDGEWTRGIHAELVSLAASLTGSLGAYLLLASEHGTLHLRRTTETLQHRAISPRVPSEYCVEGAALEAGVPMVWTGEPLPRRTVRVFDEAQNLLCHPLRVLRDPVGVLVCVGDGSQQYSTGDMAALVVLSSGIAPLLQLTERARAERSSTDIETALSTLAHTFQGELVTAHGLLGSVLDAPGMPTAAGDRIRQAQSVLRVVDWRAQLIRDLMRSDTRPSRGDLCVCTPSQILGDAARMALEYAKTVGKTVTIETSTWPADRLSVERARMELALWELMLNGLSYGTSMVRVDCSIDGDRVVYSVWNNGDFVADDEKSAIWARDYRGRSSVQSAYDGTGWGLAFVRQVCTDHGGEAQCLDGEGGPVFRIWLPIFSSGE